MTVRGAIIRLGGAGHGIRKLRFDIESDRAVPRVDDPHPAEEDIHGVGAGLEPGLVQVEGHLLRSIGLEPPAGQPGVALGDHAAVGIVDVTGQEIGAGRPLLGLDREGEPFRGRRQIDRLRRLRRDDVQDPRRHLRSGLPLEHRMIGHRRSIGGQDVLHRTVGAHRAAVEQQRLGTQRRDGVQLVADVEDGPPLGRGIAHLLHRASLEVGVTHAEHLVDDEDLGLQVGGDGERQAHVHA
jgi:hypothetical protein